MRARKSEARIFCHIFACCHKVTVGFLFIVHVGDFLIIVEPVPRIPTHLVFRELRCPLFVESLTDDAEFLIRHLIRHHTLVFLFLCESVNAEGGASVLKGLDTLCYRAIVGFILTERQVREERAQKSFLALISRVVGGSDVLFFDFHIGLFVGVVV